MYFRLTDGLFVVESVDLAATPAAYFYQTSAAAEGAGVPGQVILDGSYRERLDDSEMANVVVVIGQAPDGTPLLARAVDWRSIQDSTAWNYVNQPWWLIVADPGLQTQAAVDLACRRLFDRHRYPRILAEWRSVRVDVWPGEIVGLVGSNYGDVYLLHGMTAEEASDGDAADIRGRASYSAELVR